MLQYKQEVVGLFSGSCSNIGLSKLLLNSEGRQYM